MASGGYAVSRRFANRFKHSNYLLFAMAFEPFGVWDLWSRFGAL
jgi:hypothetical protein